MEDEKGQEETNIKVYVRTRPFSEKEKFEGAQACVQFFEGLEQIKVGAQVYTFDRVFRTKDEQQHVYEKCGVPILTKFLEGYNCTILAYGQTGSGKTFTMGTEETMDGLEKETRGLIPRLVSDLFKAIEESSCPSSYKVAVSMLEIYQDELADLLSSSRDSLSIREQKGTVFVQGLSSSLVKGLHETMAQLGKGCQARAKGSTAMNAQSSRSHAIFTITLQKTSVDENECSFTAKFHLVDLAGSERLKKTQAEGERKKEGIKINEGLLALGNVISSLSDGLKHVPYRDSKITRLLQDSLGGTSYTIMIACISPADTNGEETLSTLRYADRAKRIKNNVVLNVDPQEALIKELRDEILRLRHEIATIKSEDGYIPPSSVPAAPIKEKASATVANLENRLLETKIALALKARREEAHEKLVSSLTNVMENQSKTKDDKLEELMKLLSSKNSNDDSSADEEPMEQDDDQTDNENMEEEESEELGTLLREKCFSLDRDFEQVSNLIKEKENLLGKAKETTDEMSKMQEKHAKDVCDLQEKIQCIQKERDSLNEQLRKLGNSSKLAEERRKRLMELEKELASNKKRLQELCKLEQMKIQSEQNAKRMQKEIEELKMTRIRLIKSMKIEADKFRVWKAKHERQMLILKTKERKLERDAAKTKQALTLQLDVFKKRYQEALACNKRLQDQRLKSSSHSRSGKMDDEQLKKYVLDQIVLLKTAQEASLTSEGMIQFRKQLAKKMCGIQAQISQFDSEPSSKYPEDDDDWLNIGGFVRLSGRFQRRMTMDRDGTFTFETEEKKAKLEAELQEIQEDIDCCNEQIRDLQSDTSSIDANARFDAIFRQITNQQEGKVVLRTLFEMLVNECSSSIEKTKELEDQRSRTDELLKEFQKMKKFHVEEVIELEKKCNEIVQAADKVQVQIYGQITPLLTGILDNAAMSVDQSTLIKEMLEQLGSFQSIQREMEEDLANFKQQEEMAYQKKGLPRSASSSDVRQGRRPPERYGNPVGLGSSFYNEKTPLAERKIKRKVVAPSPILHANREREEKRMTMVFDKAPCNEQENSPMDSENLTFNYDPNKAFAEDEGSAARNQTFLKEDSNKTFLLDNEDVDVAEVNNSLLGGGSRRKTNARSNLGRIL